jgi:hypothetical protein
VVDIVVGYGQKVGICSSDMRLSLLEKDSAPYRQRQEHLSFVLGLLDL